MWSAVSANEPALMSDFLDARDARQRRLQQLSSELGGAASILMISANIPGADKHRPGVSRLLREALDSLQEALGLEMCASLTDLLGPFLFASTKAAPLDAKRVSVALESGRPAARLLDVDVYDPQGVQVDRARLGLPQRSCLICGESARECIRLRRHSQPELLACVDKLLEPFTGLPGRISPAALAAALPKGALRELDLTPKPGLVDRKDNGSHSDLTYESMRTSAELLPRYYEDILQCHRVKAPLRAFVQAGIEAESRMTQAIHSNAHKGYLFLSGLVLMAACACGGRLGLLRKAVGAAALRFFADFGSRDSHGALLRERYGLGGIRTEAELGLPSVFEHGWPKYREALAAGWDPERAGFYLLAVLMQRVEDTTALHRCGTGGLSRLHRDGFRLQRLLEQQQAPEPALTALNLEYRSSGLTMGGVADCLALTFALQEAVTPGLLGRRSNKAPQQIQPT